MSIPRTPLRGGTGVPYVVFPPRQRQALELLARGYRIREAARRMGITPRGFRYLTGAVCVRLHADTITHAVVLGIALGVIDLDIVGEGEP